MRDLLDLEGVLPNSATYTSAQADYSGFLNDRPVQNFFDTADFGADVQRQHGSSRNDGADGLRRVHGFGYIHTYTVRWRRAAVPWRVRLKVRCVKKISDRPIV